MINSFLTGDARERLQTLPPGIANCCVTSPPYYRLRDYGVAGQIGLEETPEAYLYRLVQVFREVRRVLTHDGTLWLNIGDSYAAAPKNRTVEQACAKSGLKGKSGQIAARKQPTKLVPGYKPKDLMGIPWRLALALQQPWLRCRGCGEENHESQWAAFPDNRRFCPACQASAGADVSEPGWYLRKDIIWHKLNPMPESVTDRPTTAHEYVFLLSKSERYYYDAAAISEVCSEQTHLRVSKKQIANRAPRPGVDDRGGNQGKGGIPGVSPKSLRGDGQFGVRNNASFNAATLYPVERRNKRSVWSMASEPSGEDHYATYPEELPYTCILAGCPPAGRRCDCEEVIATPLGTVEHPDESLLVGRAGMSRRRGQGEGTRPITRREQRHYARQMKASPHRATMLEQAGPAFAHYIRTDRVGARPLPEKLLQAWLALGWLTAPEPCACPEAEAGVVLDPFMGVGTTALVARKLSRRFIGVELNPRDVARAQRRLYRQLGLFA